MNEQQFDLCAQIEAFHVGKSAYIVNQDDEQITVRLYELDDDGNAVDYTDYIATLEDGSISLSPIGTDEPTAYEYDYLTSFFNQ